MKDATPKAIHLKDYEAPKFNVSEIDISFDIFDDHTIVTSGIHFERNKKVKGDNTLLLNGEHQELLEVHLDAEQLEKDKYSYDGEILRIENMPDSFQLRVRSKILPHENKALDGLYQSGEIFCTQNEPQGFRRITFFPDRPDVMAKYTTKIIADKKKLPVLLSNGNLIESGKAEGGRHYAIWEDPFKKPSYLFAMVAGDLGMIEDKFTTMSGREIDLKIYCDKGNEVRCYHAMESLKKSMKWDEEVYGLEYDLDIYMIVAVDAFNMGAMENKGLNIFNTSCVLADEKTATDIEFQKIECIIGHEYFHNWTGNRVTCRDWFQLTLKEGLTVFRDQEFSADMTSRTVKRIEDVAVLKNHQFPEDNGPMAHPIRPDTYIEINNFYTATVYDKGSEVIRMVHTLIGAKNFRKGMDTYFERHDGQAVTTEDFILSMEAGSGHDLKQFRNWYEQAGTPIVHVDGKYDSSKKEYALTIKQENPLKEKNKNKDPLYFPFKVSLLGTKGKVFAEKVLIISKEIETFVFDNIATGPVLSLNQSFSAPVKVQYEYESKDLAFLMAYDNDEFNRYEAGQLFGKQVIESMIEDLKVGREVKIDPLYLESYEALLKDEKIDRSFKSYALGLPTQEDIIEDQKIADFINTVEARELLYKEIAKKFEQYLKELYKELSDVEGKFDISQESIGRRDLKNTALSLLTHLGNEEVIALLEEQFKEATNMTDKQCALANFAHIRSAESEKAFADFYKEWKDDKLVICKWFSSQLNSRIDNIHLLFENLMKDPAFDIDIPNIVRAIVRPYIRNYRAFHEESGKGYDILADFIIRYDAINPQTAAGIVGGFKKFKSLDDVRKPKMQKALEKILAKKDLSKNVYEIASKTLESGK